MSDRRCVVVGDVVGSREVPDREALHDRLETGLSRANDAVEGDDVAPFTTLKGVDEVGGVLATPARAYAALREIAETIHPTEIRFAVTWGTVDVGLNADDVAAMDGPAFHAADEILEGLANTGRYVGLAIDGADPWVETLLANQMHLIFMWKHDWTGDQGDVVRQYRELGTMAAVADERDVSVQAVSAMLGRAEARTILALEEDLQRCMESLWSELT